MMDFNIALNGLQKLAGAMQRYPAEIKAQMQLAGRDAATMIISTQGLQRYPPKTERNAPGRMRTVTFSNGRTAQFRMSYYHRTYGTMTPVRGGGYRLITNSQNFSKKFYIKPSGEMDTIVGNNATYGEYLTGKGQVGWAAEVGWRKLAEVAKEKGGQIRLIYERHINYVSKKLGL